MHLIEAYSDPWFTWISSYVRKIEQKQQILSKNTFNTTPGEKIPRHGRDLGRDSVIMGAIPWSRSVESEIMNVGGAISVVENVWSVGETVVKRGNWRGQRRSWETLSTLTSENDIRKNQDLWCDSTWTDDSVTTTLGKHNFTFGLGKCCYTTDGIGIKKRNYWFYMALQGHMYVHVNWLTARVLTSFH